MKNNKVTEFCTKHNACPEGVKWAKKYKTLSDVFDNCPRGDWLIWMLRKADKLSQEQKVMIAVACAEHVLWMFEKKYPDDKRPRKAIESAKEWIKNPSKENAAAAADAGTATAYATADAYAAAAATAAAAAYAADAYTDAYAAAAAAADAADAATDAAYAAADADADADAAADADAERKWQADRIRKIVKNPWRILNKE